MKTEEALNREVSAVAERIREMDELVQKASMQIEELKQEKDIHTRILQALENVRSGLNGATDTTMTIPDKIREFIASHPKFTTSELVKGVQAAHPDTSRQGVANSLAKLVRRGRIQRVDYGHYAVK